jgi:hypothetical protein
MLSGHDFRLEASIEMQDAVNTGTSRGSNQINAAPSRAVLAWQLFSAPL